MKDPDTGSNVLAASLPSMKGKEVQCFGLPDGGYHQYPYSSLYIAVSTQG